MVTDFPIQNILDHLVKRIVEILPISAAGVTLISLISPGLDPRYIAASNGDALVFEQLQSTTGEGPCLAAYHSGEAISVPDLEHDARFRDSRLWRWRPAWRPYSRSRCATVRSRWGA